MSFIFLLTLTMACKKDQITVDEEKEYAEVSTESENSFPYDGGWRLTMQTNGVADVLPGGDIVYRGTYKISGSTIKVKTEQNDDSYTFEIISKEEIKEKTSGIILKLVTKN